MPNVTVFPLGRARAAMGSKGAAAAELAVFSSGRWPLPKASAAGVSPACAASLVVAGTTGSRAVRAGAVRGASVDVFKASPIPCVWVLDTHKIERQRPAPLPSTVLEPAPATVLAEGEPAGEHGSLGRERVRAVHDPIALEEG